jgi:hypothetical protein
VSPVYNDGLHSEILSGTLLPAMPTNSNAVGAKKGRKKPKAPQVIAPEVWVAIEKAVVGGMGYSEASRRFHVSVFAIMQRSKRNNWPVGSRIQRRVEALQQARYKAREHYKPYDQLRDSNAQATAALAESWVERGEVHRNLVYRIANAALIKAVKDGVPVESARDLDLIDRAGRRATGLDASERELNVSIGMMLVNQRIENSLNLPKDQRTTPIPGE